MVLYDFNQEVVVANFLNPQKSDLCSAITKKIDGAIAHSAPPYVAPVNIYLLSFKAEFYIQNFLILITLIITLFLVRSWRILQWNQ